MTGPFRFYQLARFSSTVSMQMLSVAVGWRVYEATNEPMSLGFVGLAQFLPMLTLSLVTGHAADRFDRKTIVAACFASLAIASLALMHALEPTAIYLLLVVVGIARAFAGPAAHALSPQLVPEEVYPRAVAATSSLIMIGMVVGPALGGTLYKVAGPVVLFSACAGLFVVSVIATALIHPRERPRAAIAAADLRTLLSGIRYVVRNKTILGAISLDMFGVLFGGAVALLPIYARDILHTGPIGLGLLRSAPAVGAAATGAWLSFRPIRGRAGPKLLVAMVGFGASTIAFGVSHDFALSLAALLVVGAADMVNVVIRMTLVQLATPDEMRGRVSAVNGVFIGASNELGELESGLTAQWMGPVASVVFGGACTMVIALAWTKLFPAIRKIDKLEDVKP
jgi:MFS family permease